MSGTVQWPVGFLLIPVEIEIPGLHIPVPGPEPVNKTSGISAPLRGDKYLYIVDSKISIHCRP